MADLLVTHTSRLITDFSRAKLAQWCEEHDQPAYRADQIWQWLFAQRVAGFDAMQTLPARFRTELAEQFALFSARVVQHHVAKDRTEKLLLELPDGERIECVLMREPDRRTVCISTQVGCAMGCVFCASGLLGLKRNLSTGEILEQVLRLDRLLVPAAKPTGGSPWETTHERITNVVVMGIGEPLANLKSLVPALDALHDTHGMGLGARRITISTVGLPEKIRELAALGRPYNLAVSLHAPNDALRNELVPVNKPIGIRAILAAADEYFQKTGRRVTYEYVLLGGINDAPQHARQLGVLLKGRNAHVNLIPMNDVHELPFHAPAAPQTRRFVEHLQRAGVTTTVRKRKGADIEAACGQLRLQHEQT